MHPSTVTPVYEEAAHHPAPSNMLNTLSEAAFWTRRRQLLVLAPPQTHLLAQTHLSVTILDEKLVEGVEA